MKQEAKTMKINASRFLAGVLAFGAILTVSLVRNNASSAPPPGGTAGQERRIRERPVPANGKGLNESQIEGIYLHLSYNLTGIGGTVQLSYPSYLLLKDGTIHRNLKTPPTDLDVAKSREAEPKKWGRWEKRGASIIVQWNEGRRETWDKYWYIARPAKKTDRLKGVYGYITGGGSTTVAAAVNIKFSDDGSFARQGVVSDLNNALYTYSKSDSAGTYVLDGYTIELRYANGKMERHLFYFYPDSNNVIGIGEQAYTLDK
jgi:hypothetical protein